MPTLETDDARLHYEDVGAGPPILFLHGLGSSSADWELQLERFAPRYRCLALDARGSGRSRDLAHPAGPFSIPRFAADAAALLDRVGAAPAHVVGLSMGGMIAFQLAVDHPRAVRTLTVVNSAPAVVARNRRERAVLRLRELITQYAGPAVVARLLARPLFPKPEHAELRRAFVARVSQNEPGAYLATTRALMGWSVADRIGEIAVPALVVAAERDYTPVAAKREYARRMQRAELVVVPDARHALPVEDPARFNAVLEDFLARHAG